MEIFANVGMLIGKKVSKVQLDDDRVESTTLIYINRAVKARASFKRRFKFRQTNEKGAHTPKKNQSPLGAIYPKAKTPNDPRQINAIQRPKRRST